MNNDSYFYRTAVISRRNQQVALADINNPEKITPLDEWLGTVMSLADGAHTINEMMTYLRSRYPQPPENLDETLQSVVERLLEGNLIALSEKVVTLPYYLAEPIELLDLDKARDLIRQDGHISGQYQEP